MMLTLENALLLDIVLGFPFGISWFPEIGETDALNIDHAPETFLLKGEQLAAIKAMLTRGNNMANLILEGLQSEADCLLKIKNPSVTQKPIVPKGISPNDYYSLALYWWPNTKSPGGLPYIRRDGKVNPVYYSNLYDAVRLRDFTEATFLLSLAAYITGKDIYAKKASSLIETWLLEPETRQTPHFFHAQKIPGINKLRYHGIIEARRLIYVCEAIQLLHCINAITNRFYNQCVKWFVELLHWLEYSEHGQKAKSAKNNIGFWYDLQRVIYARFCKQNHLAENVIRDFVLQRIDEQIDEEGKLPHELLRAKPYDYVAFTLLALSGIIAASRHGEIQLPEHATDEGRSFENAFTWFSETIKKNNLQTAGTFLSQLIISQKQISELKAENKAYKSSMQNASSKNFENKNEFQRLIAKLHNVEKECDRLRSELSNNYLLFFNAAIRYRGLEYLLKQAQQH